MRGDLNSLISAKDPGVAWKVHGARIALQVAQAVAHCHLSHIINRDLKSANVLLTGKYEVKLCDFGLAKRLPTETSYLPHIPPYAPQWASPEALHPDGRQTLKSDIYRYEKFGKKIFFGPVRF